MVISFSFIGIIIIVLLFKVFKLKEPCDNFRKRLCDLKRWGKIK